MTDPVAAFLTGAGFAEARRIPLAGDASARRYERLIRPDKTTALLMTTPNPADDIAAFMRVGRILVGFGLSAPAVSAVDVEHGLAIIEDFGDETFTRRLDGGADPRPLYRLAVDVLIELHHKLPGWAPILAELPVFDAPAFVEQTMLFTDVHIPAALGQPLADAGREEFAAAWREVVVPACVGATSMILRDYHVDNVMVLPRTGIRAAGVIDFQNGGPGPVAYDLVSLLEDARRDVDADLAAAMIERYLAAFPGLDAAAFRRSYAVLGAVRHTRIVGIFERMALKAGRREYLAHLPRVWRLLEAKLADPALAPVARWFDRYVPENARAGFVVPEAD